MFVNICENNCQYVSFSSTAINILCAALFIEILLVGGRGGLFHLSFYKYLHFILGCVGVGADGALY